MSYPELLSPVGDFECLKAAVQNGADTVYLGASNFNARARATNFENEELKAAIKYAKLRNVKVNLTLNTLLKNDELDDAIELAIFAYNAGVDAIIIQDIGLALHLKEHYPEIKLHASTQMTVHNLEGVKQLEALGFSRVVLSRELSISEIEYIRKNTQVELEVFIHGALCISYSGQCLFSSMVGNRSGNRGSCAQPCRLPYELYENENLLDKGYLLSPRDQAAIDYLPALVKNNIDCFKIEGRLKTPEYVATVTRIYRKYIDYIKENIDKSDSELISEIHSQMDIKNVETGLTDKEELLQVFNRGSFSDGHFSSKPNTSLVYSKKSNNMGLYLGKIKEFKEGKGHITLNLENNISIGDRISINNDNYTVSELMIKNNNYHTLEKGKVATIGRMKGNIKPGMPIYKIESKALNEITNKTFSQEKELKKIHLKASIYCREKEPIKLTISSLDGDFYKDLKITIYSEQIVQKSQNKPLTEDIIIKQLSKTGNTEFEFVDFEINLGKNLFLPLSLLNDLRRDSLIALENAVMEKYTHNLKKKFAINNLAKNKKEISPEISVLLNIINDNFDYTTLIGIDKLYIPYKYFSKSNIIANLCKNFNSYIYMPTIIKDSYYSSVHKILENAVSLGIKGFVVSNLSQIELVKKYNLPIIANYNLNIYNNETINRLQSLGVSTITPSVELEKLDLQNLINNSTLSTELIVYGKTVLMTNNYCYLGKSNKCYKECKKLCTQNKKFYLKDRLGFEFRIIPDNTCTITTIYNSKTTSIIPTDFNIQSARIDILDENINEIQKIIDTVRKGERFEGKDFTNGKIK